MRVDSDTIPVAEKYEWDNWKKIDRQQFRDLIAQESFSPFGEERKIQLVKQMIEKRLTRKRVPLKEQLQQQHPTASDDAIDRMAAEQLQEPTIRFRDIDEVEDDNEEGQLVNVARKNLIVSKGDLNNPHAYRIMILSHVDTVHAPKHLLEIRHDPARNRLRARGVYDMNGAVMNSIALAADVMIPKGLAVHFVFTADEEENSTGAKALIERWREFRNIDLILSSEIGPLVVPQENDDHAPRIILGRRGRLKTEASITIEPSSQGHASISALPNAGTELAKWVHYVDEIYDGSAANYREFCPEDVPLSHPLLGREVFEVRKIVAQEPRGYIHPDKAEFKAAFVLVPPNTISNALEQQREIARRIGIHRQWTQKKVVSDINPPLPPVTSYNPYHMPERHPAVDITKNVLRRVTGNEPVIAGALSVGDENLFATEMLARLPNGSFENTKKGIITIPIHGGKAHNEDEWINPVSMMQVREAIRQLLVGEDGFSRLSETNTDNQN